MDEFGHDAIFGSRGIEVQADGSISHLRGEGLPLDWIPTALTILKAKAITRKRQQEAMKTPRK